MKKLEFAGLHPDFQRLLNVAKENAKHIDSTILGITYLSRDGYCFVDQVWRGPTLSEKIVSGNFFENHPQISPEKRNTYFECIGVYGEKLDPELNSELQNMLTLRDKWNLPIYLMNKKEDVWRIEPNDECGRNLTLMTTAHPSHIKDYQPLVKKY